MKKKGGKHKPEGHHLFCKCAFSFAIWKAVLSESVINRDPLRMDNETE